MSPQAEGDGAVEVSPVEVSTVGPEAADEVVKLIHAAFAARPVLDPPSTALEETAESVAESLEENGGMLAHRLGRPVGALLFEQHGERLGLRRVSVHPDEQRHGIAKILVHRAEREAASEGYAGVQLEARVELPLTVRFWEHLGYGEIGRAGTTLTMAKELPVTFAVPSASRTRALGARVARVLRAGDLVILTGGLGAGKTTFTQGLGEGLAVRGEVTSPTFVIARVHPSTAAGPALVHVDAYRLGAAAELDDLDLDASLQDAVTVVEWGAGLAEALTDDRLEVTIDRRDDDERYFTFNPVGARWVGSGIAAAVRPK